MLIHGMNVSVIKVIATIGVSLFLLSCSKNGLDQSSDAALVLSSSSFHPGESAPGIEVQPQNSVSAFEQSQNSNLASVSLFSAFSATSDTGYIPQNTGTQNGGSDTGSIPQPVTATTTTAPSISQDTSSITSTTVLQQPEIPTHSSTGNGGTTSPVADSNGTGVSSVTTSTLPSSSVATGGTDSGNIPGPGSISGNDTGNIPSTTPATTVPVVDNGNNSQPTTPATTVPVADNGNNSQPTTPATTVPVADNGNNSQPTTPATTVPVADNHDDGGSCSCTCHNPTHVTTSPCHSKEEKVTVELGRVCSIKRSKSENLFFEEAKNPILSIEAIVPKGKIKYGSRSSNPYANSSVIQQWGVLSSEAKERILIASYDLRGIDLFEMKYHRSFSFNLKELKRKLGFDWRKAAIVTSVCDDVNNDHSCYRAEQKSYLSVVPATFKANRIPKKIALDVWNGRGLSQSVDGDVCDKQYSPIVLDLTGAGISLTAPEDGVQFDLNADGNPVYTGWIKGSNNAFLVRDVNRTGKIEDGSELFGSATNLKSGKRAANGFEALKDLDENHDRVLNALDPAWRDLRLWFDRNQDGVSQSSELERLKSYSIESINLNYVELLEMDEYGNQTRERSTYVRTIRNQEKPMLIVDIWFRTLIDQ